MLRHVVRCIRLLLVCLSLGLAIGCGGLPGEVHKAVFESQQFTGPISIDPGQGDTQELLNIAHARRVDTGLLSTIWTTSYRNSDKRLLSYLVSHGFAKVECVTVVSRYQTTRPCFVIHADTVSALKNAARRELVSIDYTNKYKASPMGMPVTFYALTFKYRIVGTIPQAPAVDGVLEGQAKAWLDPDTGKWRLDELNLSDKGSATLVEVIARQYAPFDSE